MTTKNYDPKPNGCSKSSSKMTTTVLQEVSDKLTLNWSKNAKFVAIKKGRKEIIKTRAEITEKEMKQW